MDPTLENATFLAAIGIATGILGAVLGTGGGVFLIPALVLAFHVPMRYAIATSILSVIATSSAVASTNVERGTANMRLGMTLEIATSIGAIVGGLSAGYIPARALEILFAVVLMPTCILMWRGNPIDREADATDSDASHSGEQINHLPQSDTGILGARYKDPHTGHEVAYVIRWLWAGMGISFVAGNLSGLLGIGGGVFKVPALNLLCGVPIKAAAATSNFMIGVTAAASAFLYLGRGDVRPAMTAVIVLGVLIGSAVGSILNRYVGGQAVKRLFAVLLLGVALQMIVRALVSGDHS